MTTTQLPDPGQIVHVRQRPFVVQQVRPSSLPPDPARYGWDGPQHLVALSSVEEDALGEELEVVWELEPGALVYERAMLPAPTGFDEPARLDAFLDAVRWGAISSADVRALQSPFRSGISIEDYQLDPVVRAIQMPRAKLLIADDVGLGKTVEAGLVAQELILRHRVRTVLVVCPSALQIQWRDEMRAKFGLEFRIVDSALMKELRRRRGLHVNPWTRFPRLITSIDFLKRERPLRLFREALPAPGEPVYPRRFDLLIVDEAHNVAPSGAGRYATDSQRTHAIRALAPHFEHTLFLSATPHNGYVESFSALLELLDDQRFARGIPPDRHQLGAIMVRRLKSEITDWKDDPLFPRRTLTPIEVPYTDTERRIHGLLHTYTRLRQREAQDSAEQFATEFVLKLLKKRLFSSPAAFARTLAKHEQSLATARRPSGPRGAQPPTLGILQRQVEGIDEEFADDETYAETMHEAMTSAGRLFRELSPIERKLLDEMRRWADVAAGTPDTKAAELIRWLSDNIRPNGVWSDQRVIIFTEYRDTQKWLEGILAGYGLVGGDRTMTLYGGMDGESRERIKAAFQAGPHLAPVRILLATDAASEGIDLQNHCCRLIHYEIPWNPNRMEQRNGRIDRHGQRAQEVLIYHFVGAGWRGRPSSPQPPSPSRGEGGDSHDRPVGNADARGARGVVEPDEAGDRPPSPFMGEGLGVRAAAPDLDGDLEFLWRAVQKVEVIREDLGKVGPVIATQVEEAMLGRRVRLDTAVAEREAAPVREVLRMERRVREAVERAHEQLQETRRELQLSPENVEAVVAIGLELAGQPGLRALTPPAPLSHEGRGGSAYGGRVFWMPQLGGSWAVCTEGLAHPHTGAMRPITFDHRVAEGRDDVVLVHLNHRLVQMCLRLLRAEVWAPEGQRRLHRVTARLIPSEVRAEPIVIAHGRLVVLGGDHGRLHEEIIAAGGVLRHGRFSRLNVGEVDAALRAALPDSAPDAIKRTLQELWPSHRDALLQALDARMRDRTAGLARMLAERAEKEARDVAAVLTELRRDILAEVQQPAVRQLELFTTPEREQLERNLHSLRDRADRIPAEIEHERAAIRRRYADPTPRLFPVAVTYLVPEGLR